MTQPKSGYIGRFAPSPTGPLHMGSLTAALASYLDAKAQSGLWLMRMEDLDPPREQPGSAELILQALLAHGLKWDGDVLWQSQRHEAYREAIEQLTQDKLIFHCNCTRKQLQQSHGIYDGHCYRHPPASHNACALRVKTSEQIIRFNDRIQGPQQQSLTEETGDFIIRRKDGLYAYQLAVVVDDAFQGVTDIVRGADLLDSSFRQIYLQDALGYIDTSRSSNNRPSYAHIALLIKEDGDKLSKQTHAPALNNTHCCSNLLTALALLRQGLPPREDRSDTRAILNWAIAHWQLQSLPKHNQLIHN